MGAISFKERGFQIMFRFKIGLGQLTYHGFLLSIGNGIKAMDLRNLFQETFFVWRGAGC
jgi:hypothetical protein